MIGKVLRTANVEIRKFQENQEKSPAEMFPNRTFKTRIPDFIDNKDEVKDQDIRKKGVREKKK